MKRHRAQKCQDLLNSHIFTSSEKRNKRISRANYQRLPLLANLFCELRDRMAAHWIFAGGESWGQTPRATSIEPMKKPLAPRDARGPISELLPAVDCEGA